MRLLAIVAAALVVGSRPVPADQGATPHPSGHGSVTTSPDEPAGRPLNRAASLDGVDTSLRIGMGVMPPPWTLEAWIKAEPGVAKPLQVRASAIPCT